MGEAEFPVVAMSCWSVCVRFRRRGARVGGEGGKVGGRGSGGVGGRGSGGAGIDSNGVGLEQGDEDGEGVVVEQGDEDCGVRNSGIQK